MGEANEQQERRFSQEQYDMLKRCSDKKDMTEWNEWQANNPQIDVELDDADLLGLCLVQAHFNSQVACDMGTSTYLRNARLYGADLRKAILHHAHLEGARFNLANLGGADLHDAHVQGPVFYKSHIENASLRTVVVDSHTSFWKAKVDRNTRFEGASLDTVRIDPGTKQLLEYNIRRMNWARWYKEHPILKWCVRGFWSMSDYGRSTGRIIWWFFGLAFGFAAIYANFACWRPPGIVADLAVEPHLPLWHYFAVLVLRPVYFSIVTMTTLGFEDMYAGASSIWGHVLLTFQVILGYVLLAALVTRFAVLFTAGGPAGTFADEKGLVERVTGYVRKRRKKEKVG